MSDRLMRCVRVQLTTTMDSVLRTAVFEFMRIFESALYDHKMEMAQKGEEVAQLKVKLQTTELKLKDLELMSQREAQRTKTQTEPQVSLDAPGKSVTVPEIDVEVPDDWCAPLGYNRGTKQEESFCPSVRLRQLSIRLKPVPLVKHEVDSHAVNNKISPSGKRLKRISTMNQKSNQTQAKKSPVVKQTGQQPQIRGDLNILIHNPSQDSCNLTHLDRLRRRKNCERTLLDYDRRGKKDKDPSKHKKENDTNKHSCGNCHRTFCKKQGLRVHVRFQRKCAGCMAIFCFQSAENYHKKVCAKYKALMKSGSQTQPKTSPGKGSALSSSKKRGSDKSAQPSADDRAAFTQKFSCRRCSFKTNNFGKFRKHMQTHNDKVFTSSVRLERLDQKSDLRLLMRNYKSYTWLGDQKSEPGWGEDRGENGSQTSTNAQASM